MERGGHEGEIRNVHSAAGTRLGMEAVRSAMAERDSLVETATEGDPVHAEDPEDDGRRFRRKSHYARIGGHFVRIDD